MRQIFNIFFKQEHTRPWLVLFCLFFGGLAEAVGIGTLLPLVTSVMNSGTGKPSAFDLYIREGLAWFGFPTSANRILDRATGLFAVVNPHSLTTPETKRKEKTCV